MSLLWVLAGDDDPLAEPSRAPRQRNPQRGSTEPHMLGFYGDPNAHYDPNDLLPSETHCSQRCAWESAAKHGVPMEAAQSWTAPNGAEHQVVERGKWHPHIEVDLWPLKSDPETFESLRRHDRGCDNCQKPF